MKSEQLLKIFIFWVLLMIVTNSIGLGISYAIPPNPDIKANGSNGHVNMAPNDNLSLTIKLDSGSNSGENADWWFLAETPLGWFHYDVTRASWMPGLFVTYQGPLFKLMPRQISVKARNAIRVLLLIWITMALEKHKLSLDKQ